MNRRNLTIMKKFFTLIAIALLGLMVGCTNEYDDTQLWESIKNHEERLLALEELCQEMNSNIEAMQALVTALQNHDYITSVTPITENGITIGYAIAFAKGDPITIYHGKDGKDGEDGKDGADGKDGVDGEDGKDGENGADGKDGVDGEDGKDGENGADGKDGYTPVIGVRQDSDGIYYWTLDGEWLLDEFGNKVKAVGTDGKDGQDGQDGQDGKDGKDGRDGITPMLKIIDGSWFCSLDNGESWQELGRATGEDGKDGKDGVDGKDGKDGDSFFKSVRQDERNVYFELADGTIITLPKSAPLSILFDEADLDGMYPNSTREIGYQVTSILESVSVEVVSSPDIRAKVVADDATSQSGYIEVKTGDVIDEYSKVIVFVSNDESVIMRTIVIEQAELRVESGAEKSISNKGGSLTLDFMSNVECEVIIPQSAQSWISLSPDTRALESRTITLNIEPNTYYSRRADVAVQSIDGKLRLVYTIEQEGDLGEIDPSMIPANNEVWYTTSDGKIIEPYQISEDVVSTVNKWGANIISNTYVDGKGIITFDGEETGVPDSAFSKSYAASENLTSIALPSSITVIGGDAFNRCSNLESVVMPESLNKIALYAFGECTNLKSVALPDGVETIHHTAFRKCYNLEQFKGKYAADGGRCLIKDNTLIAYAQGSGVNYTIPKGVTKIGKGAFAYCENLESVTISDGVVVFEEQAFANCRKLQEISIASSVTTLGMYSLSYCSSLASITLSECLLEIEDYAFIGCSKLTALNCKAPTPPTAIPSRSGDDWYAFDDTSKVKIYVPLSSVDSYKRAHGWLRYGNRIEGSLFDDGVDDPDVPNEIWYTSVDGKIVVPYAKSNFGANIVSNTYADGKGVIVFDNDVVSIDEHAFYWANTLSTITIPNSVKTIGQDAFYNCEALEKVVIPESVATIENKAFYSCKNLVEVELNEGLTRIGDAAFQKCENLKSIKLPNTLKVIDNSAFYYCNGIENVTIPEGVTTIGNDAFYSCANLREITLPETLRTIGERTFFLCENLKSISIPNSVETIGERCFEKCSSLEEAYIGKGLTTIASRLFIDCVALKEITIPDSVTEIGYSAFQSCTTLSSASISRNVVSLANYVFRNCTNLADIALPETLTTIGNEVFANCANLTTLKIPENVTTIGSGVFLGCEALHTFTGKGATSDGRGLVMGSTFVGFAPAGITDYVIPSHVSTIDGSVFWYCKELKNVTIPSNVTSIGASAFRECPNLTSVGIGSNVISIGTYAFYKSPNLVSVYCQPSITPLVEESAFKGNSTERKIYVPEASVEKYKVATDWSEYADAIVGGNFLGGGNEEPALPIPADNQIWYTSSDGNVVSPTDLSSMGVSVVSNSYSAERKMGVITFSKDISIVGKNAFKDATTLTSISLPESIKRIDTYAFAGSGLTEFTAPQNCWGIGNYAFYGCGNLTQIDLANVTVIDDYAFKNCRLTSVTIPESVIRLGVEPFKCSTMREFHGPNLTGDSSCLVFEKGLVQLADGICKGLASYTIPDDVWVVFQGVFQDYKYLKKVTIPEGVKYVHQNAFQGCSSLKKVILPSTLEGLGNYAFKDCTSLASLYFNAVKPPITMNIASGDEWAPCPLSTIVRVPMESVDEYKADYAWHDYTIEGFAEGDYSHDDEVDDDDQTGGNEGDGSGDGEGDDSVVDGAVTTLNKATSGNGIDIVIMGDGYTASQIASGKYSRDLRKAIDLLFDEEPYTSFKHLFNIYEVTAVSQSSVFGSGSTAFGGYFGDGTLVGGNHDKVATYAEKAISPSRINEALIIVILNREYYAGTCYMFYPVTNVDWGTGASISYFPLGTDDEMLGQIIRHEAGGHGFAKLADEYYYQSNGTIPAFEISECNSQYSDWGWWKNIDFTKNQLLVRWNKFLSDSRYAYEGLGVYEGGFTYWKGVWRPTDNSIMRHNTGGYNAPSREAIYYRIHKLAYGSSWRYDYEKFVSWDARNRKTRAATPMQMQPVKKYADTHPPVVINSALRVVD